MAERPAPSRRVVGIEEIRTAPHSRADRDMREILASIRDLMHESSTDDHSVLPEASRRQERARRFQTVAPPPKAPVDEWRDDPEIDVDALAEEVLRAAASLAERRAAKIEADAAKALRAAPPQSAPAAPAAEEPREAWGELEELLSFAQDALEFDAPDSVAAQAGADDSLVAFPTRAETAELEVEVGPGARASVRPATPYDDPDERMPDLSGVLRATEAPALERGGDLVPAPPPSAPEPQPEPAAERRPELEPEADAPHEGESASSDAAPAQVQHQPTGELEQPPAIEIVDVAASAPVDKSEQKSDEPQPDAGELSKDGGDVVTEVQPQATRGNVESAVVHLRPIQAPSAVETASTSAAFPTSSPPSSSSNAPQSVSPALSARAHDNPIVRAAAGGGAVAPMPDDPRNMPNARDQGVLKTIGDMVRARARQNIEQGVSTYQGLDPHPKIVEKTGWSRHPQRDESGEDLEPKQNEEPQPALSPTDLALRVLNDGAAADAVEAKPSDAQPGVAADQSLQPVLAEWLEQNMPRLIEHMVRAEMTRMSGPESGSENGSEDQGN